MNLISELKKTYLLISSASPHLPQKNVARLTTADFRFELKTDFPALL